MNVGDTIALPPEPSVGTLLGITGVDRDSDAVKALDIRRTDKGWFYLGHLTEDGEPGPDKWGDPIEGWDWAYVISTHRNLTVIEAP